PLEAPGALQRVEGAVDLDRPQEPRGVLELASLGQSRRVEHPAPGRVPPPRDADPGPARPRRACGSWCGRRHAPTVGAGRPGGTRGPGRRRPRPVAHRTWDAVGPGLSPTGTGTPSARAPRPPDPGRRR